MGYIEHKFKLSFALDAITAHGLPVDRKLQDDLRTHLEAEEARLTGEIQQLVPHELLPANRKEGYKSLPKDLRALLKERDLLQKGQKLDYYITNHYDLCNSLGYYWRDFATEEDPFNAGLVKVLEFNPNSSDQLLSYIRYKDYRVPKHIDTGKDTTGREELEKLIEETDDEVLRLAQKIKKITKLKGTYASGDWIPRSDGRVHGTFRFGTASQQTSCSGPNVQQWPEHYDPNDTWVSDLMHRVKRCIKAEPGHVFVKVDLRAFHARVQAFLAEDEIYYRMADFDPHSYSTAHYVGLPDANDLMSLDDISLQRRLKEIKRDYAHDRNAKVKRCTFLMQFGGGADKMFRILSHGFSSIGEVQALMDLIKGLFPKTFIDFPKETKRMLAQSPRIVTPFGCCRWIWDGDLEQAVAFRVSNCAHCMVQNRLNNLYGAGAFSTFNCVNFTHDALWFMPLEKDAEDCIKVTTQEFERPSRILISPTLGNFFVHADSQIGYDMDSMQDA